MKIFAWQSRHEPYMSEEIPSTDDVTAKVLKEIDDLLREQAQLREQIDAAKDQELQSHFRTDRRQRERRIGRERRSDLQE